MAVKNYLINDKWLDIDKQNIVEVKSTDGVIGSVKLNGEEYGGGGGSSDFSTATVTTINNTNRTIMGTHIPTVCEENELGEGAPAMLFNEMIIPTGTSTHKVRMYKGLAYCENVVLPDDLTITTSGNSEYEDGNLSITGDCTITIS